MKGRTLRDLGMRDLYARKSAVAMSIQRLSIVVGMFFSFVPDVIK